MSSLANAPAIFWKKLGPNARWNTAVHGVSHAMMALLFRGCVLSLEMRPQQICRAKIWANLRQLMLLTLSGTIAEMIYCRADRPCPAELLDALYVARTGDTVDFGDCADALALLVKEMPHAKNEVIIAVFEEWWKDCTSVVMSQFFVAMLFPLAHCLCEREFLDGYEVNRRAKIFLSR